MQSQENKIWRAGQNCVSGGIRLYLLGENTHSQVAEILSLLDRNLGQYHHIYQAIFIIV